MRPRIAPYALVATALLLVAPLAAHAAGIPYFGPIIPAAHDLCPGNWGMVVLVANNLIAFLITISITFVAPLLIAYAGFLLVANPFNPGAKEQAKTIILNTVIGIVVALASWLIVDALMSVLYNGAAGTWSSIVSGNTASPCLEIAGSLNQAQLPNGTTGTITGIGSNGQIYGSGAQCQASNNSCSVSSLESQGYNSAQANAMSCIAITESSGNAYTPNSPTGACGTFQILQSNWNKPSLHQGQCSSSTSCNDPYCNAQSAYLLSQGRIAKGQSPYSDWTCNGCNAKAQGCVDRYDPGH